MWQAKIESKNKIRGIYEIGVIFTDGEDSFSESYKVISSEDLNNMVKSKLEELNLVNLEDVELGPFVPTVKKEKDSDFNKKVLEVQRLKMLAETGVIETDSPEYVQALAEANQEYKKLWP